MLRLRLWRAVGQLRHRLNGLRLNLGFSIDAHRATAIKGRAFGVVCLRMRASETEGQTLRAQFTFDPFPSNRPPLPRGCFR